MFTKLKQITDVELKTKAVDCVVGVRFLIIAKLNENDFFLF
jgi:hypothetical protein